MGSTELKPYRAMVGTLSFRINPRLAGLSGKAAGDEAVVETARTRLVARVKPGVAVGSRNTFGDGDVDKFAIPFRLRSANCDVPGTFRLHVKVAHQDRMREMLTSVLANLQEGEPCASDLIGQASRTPCLRSSRFMIHTHTKMSTTNV